MSANVSPKLKPLGRAAVEFGLGRRCLGRIHTLTLLSAVEPNRVGVNCSLVLLEGEVSETMDHPRAGLNQEPDL